MVATTEAQVSLHTLVARSTMLPRPIGADLEFTANRHAGNGPGGKYIPLDYYSTTRLSHDLYENYTLVQSKPAP